jgi:hypothetical protein
MGGPGLILARGSLGAGVLPEESLKPELWHTRRHQDVGLEPDLPGGGARRLEGTVPAALKEPREILKVPNIVARLRRVSVVSCQWSVAEF